MRNRSIFTYIRYGVVYLHSVFAYRLSTFRIRRKFLFHYIGLLGRKAYLWLFYRCLNCINFLISFPIFLQIYFGRQWWSRFLSYATDRTRYAYSNILPALLSNFKKLREKQAYFIELYAFRKVVLFDILTFRQFVFWKGERPLFYRLMSSVSYTPLLSHFYKLIKGAAHLLYGKGYHQASVQTVPFTLLRQGYRIQNELNADQLAKRWRDPMLKAENNMVYIRYYYPISFHAIEGPVMHIIDTFRNDVFPAGPDLLDFEAYFEFDGTPPIVYEEESWDLGFSLPDRFRSWLNHTTYFGTKPRITELMMDYEIYQLHEDLDEMLKQMKDRSSASFVGVRGLDDYLARFKGVMPDLLPSQSSVRVDAFDKFWGPLYDKLSHNPYAGFSTVQTFAFMGPQLAGVLLLVLIMGILTHWEYEAFIRVHAPWLQDFHYTKLFFMNSTHDHYLTREFKTYHWWPIVYEGTWDRLTHLNYYYYLYGRFTAALFLIFSTVIGWRVRVSNIQSGLDLTVYPNGVRLWSHSYLPWNAETYNLLPQFESLRTYCLMSWSSDLYFAKLQFPFAGLDSQTWGAYLASLFKGGLFYIGSTLISNPILILLAVGPLGFLFLKLLFFRFSSRSMVGGELQLALSPLSSVLPYSERAFIYSSLGTHPITQTAILAGNSSSALNLLTKFRPVLFSSELTAYYDYFIYPAARDLLSFKFDYLAMSREFLHIPDLRALYPYNNWVGWYTPTEEDELMDQDMDFLTEEADDEEDDSDDPGTDTDYEMEYGMTSFNFGVRAPLYSTFFKRCDELYYNRHMKQAAKRLLKRYQCSITKDLRGLFGAATFSNKTISTFLPVLRIPQPSSLILTSGLFDLIRFPRKHYRRVTKRFFKRQFVHTETTFHFQLFELNDITLPTFYFPYYSDDSTAFIFTFNSDYFSRRASFVEALFAADWYKKWIECFFYRELKMYLFFRSLQLRNHESTFRTDPILRDIPHHLEDNQIELFDMLDEELGEVMVDTTAYPLDFIVLDSDSDDEHHLHNFFENPITMKLGFASSTYTYDLPFMFYHNDGREELVYSLNDFYWAANTMQTWLPVVPEDGIDYIPYLTFAESVSIGPYLLNGFYVTLYGGLFSDDAVLLNKASEIRDAYGPHIGYNLYSWSQLQTVGAWPYGLGPTQLDHAVMETVMKRLGSTDPDAMDWVNFTSVDLSQFPHLSYEQRMYMLLDWKMRQFLNIYVMLDIQNANDASDMEILDYYTFEPWLSETEVWVIFPDDYSYDSLW